MNQTRRYREVNDNEKCWCGYHVEDHRWNEVERKLHCPYCYCEECNS